MRNAKILIVDDKPENLQIMVDFFEEDKLSYEITKAPNGFIALRLINKNKPDLIITDWEMPDMDGIELTKTLKQNPNTSDIPIIMCTGFMISSENLKTALHAGAIDYIRKPIDKLELIARTSSALMLAQSQKEIIRQNIALKELNVTKDKFVSIIAHDLINPFNVIMGFSELIKTNILEDNFDDIELYINKIAQVSEQTYTLLKNLLQWGRTLQDALPFYPEIIKLDDIIKENILLLEPMAITKSITIKKEVPSSLNLRADKEMINTVIRNLITNALKFTHINGVVKIAAIKEHQSVVITISDTGIGMSNEIKESLFSIKESKSQRGTLGEHGTGLGLLLCKEFVEKHNGTISVESVVNKGSKFIINVPLTQSE